MCRKEIQHPRPEKDRLRFLFLGLALHFRVCFSEGAGVLLLQAGVVDVTALRRSRPHPAVSGFPGKLPVAFKDEPDSRRHRNRAASGRGLTVSDEYGSIPAVLPVNILPAHSVTFFQTHAAVREYRRNRL